MNRLPIVNGPKSDSYPIGVTLTADQRKKIDAEKKRIGARGRATVISMIIDLYFEES